MGTRLVVGLSLALLLIGLLLLDGYVAAQPVPAWCPLGLPAGRWLANGAICTVIVLVLTVLATHELVHLARARGHHPFGLTTQLFAAALVVGPYVSYNLRDVTGGYDESWGLLWMAIALGWVFGLQAMQRGAQQAMENTSITVFIIFYAGGLASFLTKLRMEVGGAAGVAVLMFSVFLVKMTDTGAYFVGRAFGRHKFVPWLSPKKTWEGFVGGLVVTLICAVGVGHWLHATGLVRIVERPPSHLVVLVVVGLLLGIVSVAGDLCASLLKRDAAVKDSGRVFPGLGGVLDVLDSPLLAAPAAWLLWTRLFHVVPG